MKKLIAPDENKHIIEHPIIAAITSEIVGINGLTTYWRETIRVQREEEVFSFLRDVSRGIAELYKVQQQQESRIRNKLDLAHIESEDFKRTLAKMCEIAIREGDQAKAEYLKAFLLNYALEKRPDVTEKQLYLSLLEGLAGVHVVLLKALYDRQKNLSANDLIALQSQPERAEVLSRASLEKAMEIHAGLIELIIHKVDVAGLIAVLDSPERGTDRSQRLVLRPVGRSFMRFLLGDWS